MIAGAARPRIHVVGAAGSGTTTLAQALANDLAIPRVRCRDTSTAHRLAAVKTALEGSV